MAKSGIAFHCHHDQLYEDVYDFDERVNYIKHNKPLGEQELRLRLFKLIPDNLLPCDEAQKALEEAWKARDEAWKAYDEAQKAYDEAWKAYVKLHDNDIKKLHAELCPDCPWDGTTIFTKKGE